MRDDKSSIGGYLHRRKQQQADVDQRIRISKIKRDIPQSKKKKHNMMFSRRFLIANIAKFPQTGNFHLEFGTKQWSSVPERRQLCNDFEKETLNIWNVQI